MRQNFTQLPAASVQPADVLQLSRIYKTFGDCVAIAGVDMRIGAGQLVALLGPSGCGKTTLLRLVAGFEWPEAGTIHIGGRLVAGQNEQGRTVRVPAENRRVGMVFQDYALFPHVNVTGNVGFGLRGSAQVKAARVAEALALVGLADLGERMPHELSGGQQQRVALARALAPEPDVLLLDEPFSNLDAALRTQVRLEVRSILRAAGTTCIFVTHDQEEALSLADVVAVMIDGRIAQVASPEMIYRAPANRTVAAFVGEANFIPGQSDGVTVNCELGRLPILSISPIPRGLVDVLIRPEALRFKTDGFPARILWREFYGHTQRLGLELRPNGDRPVTLVARVDPWQTGTQGDTVRLNVVGPVQVFAREVR